MLKKLFELLSHPASKDDPGREASAQLKGKYPMFHILPIVGGKDHTEAMVNGLDLNEWFNEGRKIVDL